VSAAQFGRVVGGFDPVPPLSACRHPRCLCGNTGVIDRAHFHIRKPSGAFAQWADVLAAWGPSGMPPSASGAAVQPASATPTKLNWTGYRPRHDPPPLKRPTVVRCDCGSAATYGPGGPHADWCAAS